MTETQPLLDPIEARILGVLIEKEAVTPDVYPLTVNSLMSGCNQKTSRDPVLQVTEREIQSALDALKSRTLVVESYGASGRVLRYAHNFGKVFGVPKGAVVVLAVLMLRSAQTAAELRANSDRIYRFADVSTVEGYLEELAGRAPAPMVVRLPKQPGSREHRWAHCLCGAPDVSLFAAAPVVSAAAAAADELRSEVARLSDEVRKLSAEVAELRSRMG